jgi:hypothetical protein
MSFRLLLVLIAGSLSAMAQSKDWQVALLPESRLAVMGSSNINRFTFWYKEALSADHTFAVHKKGGLFEFDQNMITLRVRSFDSGNAMMNSDFLKMMNESANPTLHVALVAFHPRWKEDSTWSDGEVELSVTINGRTRLIRAPGQRIGSGLFISGSPTVSLQEFELTAPSRLMGMVRVNDNIEVVLILHLAGV